MSSEHIDFKQWDTEMQDVEIPEMPPEHIEQLAERTPDAVYGARALQYYIESQPPEAHDRLVQRAVSALNNHYIRSHMNCKSIIRVVADGFGELPKAQSDQMAYLLAELRNTGEVQAYGLMTYFEKHNYTDQETGITRPIISFRMHSGAFLRSSNNQQIGVPEFITVPITSITDHHIQERTRE